VTPTYREHPPHAALARHVECYWSMRAELDPVTPVAARVLPDGCMDIIVGVSGSDGAPYAVGTMTRPLDVTYAGSVDLFAVRFRAGAARPFLDAPADDLTDATASLDTLWGGRSEELLDRLATAPSASERIQALDALLLERLDRGPAADERVLRAAELLVRRRGGVSVEELAKAVGLGRRQLERRFRVSVGVTPKLACRVARLRRAVSLLDGRPETSLADVAFAAGYADQPHLTRELRMLAGTTPAQRRRARREPDFSTGGPPA
jgi:AraC-like DNA-binding protein